MNKEKARNALQKLTPEQQWELGILLQENGGIAESRIDKYAIRQEGSVWVCAIGSDYHQNVEQVERPLLSGSKAVLEAFQVVINEGLRTWTNRHKTEDEIDEWHRRMEEISLSDEDEVELRQIEKKLPNPISRQISYADFFSLEELPSGGSYQLQLVGVPLLGMENIQSRNVAEILMLNMFIWQTE